MEKENEIETIRQKHQIAFGSFDVDYEVNVQCEASVPISTLRREFNALLEHVEKTRIWIKAHPDAKPGEYAAAFEPKK